MKKEGREKKNKRKKYEVKLCKHRAYGRILGDVEKKQNHLTEVSKYRRSNDKSKVIIASERKKYLILSPTSELGGIDKLMMNWC